MYRPDSLRASARTRVFPGKPRRGSTDRALGRFLTGPRHGPSWAGPRVAASAVAVSRVRSRGRSYKRAAARGGSTWRWLPPGRFRHALEPAAFARRSFGVYDLIYDVRRTRPRARRDVRRHDTASGQCRPARRRRWPARAARRRPRAGGPRSSPAPPRTSQRRSARTGYEAIW